MKAIINGVRYDTEKSHCVGEGSQGNYPGDGDFSSWDAALWKTPRSGRFFLAGRGGPMTIFAYHNSDGSRSGGRRILPMTKDEALAWAEQNLTVDEIEDAFGDSIEDA